MCAKRKILIARQSKQSVCMKLSVFIIRFQSLDFHSNYVIVKCQCIWLDESLSNVVEQSANIIRRRVLGCVVEKLCDKTSWRNFVTKLCDKSSWHKETKQSFVTVQRRMMLTDCFWQYLIESRLFICIYSDRNLNGKHMIKNERWRQATPCELIVIDQRLTEYFSVCVCKIGWAGTILVACVLFHNFRWHSI